MKKILSIAFLAVLAFTTTVSAQILWKVEKPGNAHTTYILGTHHFAPVAVLDSLKSLPEIINNCDRLYGELDMEASTAPESVMKIQQYLVAPTDSTLDKVLTAEQLEAVKKVWNDLTGGQAPLEMMYPVKPAALSTQIAAILAMKLFPDLNPMEGLDNSMQVRAKAAGKPVAGLETMDFQMERLYGTPISYQAESLMKTINDMPKEEARSIEIANAYMSHDMDSILRIMTEEEDEADNLEQILYSRNDNWVKQLLEEMPSESLTVVVGAGHLPGERGVLNQLRKAGYNVTPVE